MTRFPQDLRSPVIPVAWELNKHQVNGKQSYYFPVIQFS